MAQIAPDIMESFNAVIDDVLPPQNPILSGLKVEPQRSTAGELLHILGYLSYPLHAISGAVESGISEDPNETAVGGFVKGITGQRKTRMADVFGLDEGKPDDDLPEWLGKEVLRFAADVPFDPLTYVGAPAKAKGLIGPAIKALGIPEGRSIISHGLGKAGGDRLMNKIAEGPIGSMFMEPLRDPKYAPVLEAERAIKRQASSVPAEELAVQTNKAIEEYFTKNPAIAEKFGKADVFQATERPGTIPELAPTVEALDPQRALQTEWFSKFNEALESVLGQPKNAGIAEEGYGFLPQRLTPEGADAALRDRKLFEKTKEQDWRKIMYWEDEAGNRVLNAKGQPVIGKASDPRTGVVQVGKDEFRYVGPENMKQSFVPDESAPLVRPVQASLAEKMPVSGKSAETWQTDPTLALLGSTKDYQSKWSFLKAFEEYKNQGIIANTDGSAQSLMKGWREVNVPGLGEMKWQAPKAVATHIEQQAGKLWDRDTPMGTIPELLDYAINKTLAGQKLKEATTWFKRNALGAPGWVTGNIGSNVGMQYQSGLNPIEIMARSFDIARVSSGKGQPVLAGITNAALKNEFKIRDLYKNQFSSEERDYLAGRAGGGKTEERINAIPFMPKFVGKGAQSVGTGIGKYNEAMFSIGGRAESNAKASVALDWLKNNAPDFATASPEERARLLDRAAQAGHEALIDYGDFSPFVDRVVSPVMPFGKWMLGITGRSGNLALNDPARLARMDRALQQIFMPLPQNEKDITDKWMRESAPIQGAFGTTFDQMADALGLPKLDRGKRMMLLGRFLPQQVLEGLASRPLDALTSSVNPFLKAPYEILANRNTFKDRPIDQVADGTGRMFANPLYGGAYSSAGTQRFGQTLPAGYDYLYGLSPGNRHFNELDQLGQAAGLWKNNYNRETPNPAEFGAWWLTGGKMFPYDASRYMKNRQREWQQTQTQLKSQMTWAAKNGDYNEVARLSSLIARHAAERGKVAGMSSGNY